MPLNVYFFHCREFNPLMVKLLPYKVHEVEQPAGLQCSMFAVWGSRTANGQLFSGRNLDWNKDTGKQIIINYSYVHILSTINDKSLQGRTKV